MSVAEHGNTSPGHSLIEVGAKLVENDRHPHVLVGRVGVVVTQKYDLQPRWEQVQER